MLPQNSLYNIQRSYLDILRLVEDADGEITPESDQALLACFQQLQEAALNIGGIIKTLDYNEDVIAAEITRLTNLKHKVAKSRELLKCRLSDAMQQQGVERIESPTLTLSFRKSEYVEVYDDMAVPAVYMDYRPAVPNKFRIKEALKAGEAVPGAELATRLNLQIK